MNFSPVRIFRSLKNPEVLAPSRSKPLKKLFFIFESQAKSGNGLSPYNQIAFRLFLFLV